MQNQGIFIDFRLLFLRREEYFVLQLFRDRGGLYRTCYSMLHIYYREREEALFFKGSSLWRSGHLYRLSQKIRRVTLQISRSERDAISWYLNAVGEMVVQQVLTRFRLTYHATQMQSYLHVQKQWLM